MSAKSATGLAAQSVQNWVIDSDVENQLCSDALKRRLRDKSLSDGCIGLYLRFYNLSAIGWGKQQPFTRCDSLLRVDLTGCPKLESIPQHSFSECRHLASAVFSEHSNITNLGEEAFSRCYALTTITLPDKLTVIEKMVFSNCSALERVVFNKNLKTIGDGAFQLCFSLKSVTLPDKLKIIEYMAFNDCTSLELLQQKPQDYWRYRIPNVLLARRCPACTQIDFLWY